MDVVIIKPTEKHIEQMVKLADEGRAYHINLLNGYFQEKASSAELEVIEQHMLQPEKHIIFIAVDEKDCVLGMVFGEIVQKPWLINSNIGHVSNLVVSELVRRKGIGKKLMDAFIAECRNRGMQEVTLGVYNKNKNSYDFYINYGFQPIEQKMSIKL